MRFKILSVFLVAFLLWGGNVRAHEGSHSKKEKNLKKNENYVRMVGEILDMSCYLDHGAKGLKHRKCAIQCCKNGATMGFLSSKGILYTILIDPHEDEQLVKPELAGLQLYVKGEVFEKQGQRYLKITELEVKSDMTEEGSGKKEGSGSK